LHYHLLPASVLEQAPNNTKQTALGRMHIFILRLYVSAVDLFQL
jgi:hypothetical protein